MSSHVLFCSSVIWSQFAVEIEAAVAGIEVISFTAGQHISDADAARITMAFSSDDLYMAGLPGFFKVCLQSPSLQWIQVSNAGIDHPVFGMLLDKGLRMTAGSGTAAVPIAQHVIMCLLALARDLPGMLTDQRRHDWKPRPIDDLEGRTVGILGMGPIGSEAARLALHFGMKPIGMRRTVTGDEPCETWTLDRLDDLLGLADDLVLALPLTEQTRRLIGRRELAVLRAGARLVNVGRGELVDEDALIDALVSGHLAGAALDVFSVEPLPADSALWDMPHVIVTPHNSGESDATTRRVNELFLENLRRWAADEPLLNEVGRSDTTPPIGR